MAAFLVIPQEMITVLDVGVNSFAYQTPLDAPVQQDSWESIVQQNVTRERMEPIVCKSATALQVTSVPRIQENALMGLSVKKAGLVSTVKFELPPFYSIPGTTSASSGITSSTIPIVEATTQAFTSATTPAPTTVPPQLIPSSAIESFFYTKVNNGGSATLVCIVTGSPPPTSENISVTHAAGGDEGIVLLESTVHESTRTSWYRVRVSLDDVPRNFTCLLRRLDGESVSKDLAVSVYAIPGTTSASSGTTSSTISFVETIYATTQATTSATTFATPPIPPQPDSSYAIASFFYTKVNNGEPTTLVCVVTGSPPPTSENISVTYAAGADEGIVLLETNVNESTRTSRYQVRVSLGEAPQNFTCLLRRPNGENVSKDLAVSVYEPPSFVESNILVQEMTSHSVTIRWTHWNETNDRGDGPVIGYRVYHSTHGQGDIARASSDRIRDTTFTITNLTRDTVYDFRVTASREGPSGEGMFSSVARARTKCTGPARVGALQMSPSTTQIEVSWETSSSLCSPDYYIIRYSLYQKLACQSPETTPTEFEVNTNITQYNILVGLEPYSQYKIIVTAVNGAGQSEPMMGYSETRPGRE
eukprot:XP_011671316.1 PREDICTED: mucin-5AC-like [Strongylocentrotus purpuratus]